MKTINNTLLLLFITGFTTLSSQSITTYGTNAGTLGVESSYFGIEAGRIATGHHNSFFGWEAGYNDTTGYDNVFVGSRAGYTTTSGMRNVFMGHYSGYNNSTGESNVFIGFYSGRGNTLGRFNVFLGNQTGYLNTTGVGNVFIGSKTGYNNTTAGSNVFIGNYSGHKNTIGSSNVILGNYSGYSNISGTDNLFMGDRTGYENTIGTKNVFLGKSAGYENTTGERNVFMGFESGFNNLIGTGNLFIGHKAGFNETGSDKLYIDNTDTSTPLLYGNFTSDQLGVNTNIIPAGYTFAVKGKMIAEELKVQVFPWADFVFESTYKLPTLAEVEQHIKEKGHLQNIPSAKEVAKNGISVGQMEAKLLQKIEELTLYTIQQQKELQKQQQENKILETRLRKIESFLNTKYN